MRIMNPTKMEYIEQYSLKRQEMVQALMILALPCFGASMVVWEFSKKLRSVSRVMGRSADITNNNSRIQGD